MIETHVSQLFERSEMMNLNSLQKAFPGIALLAALVLPTMATEAVVDVKSGSEELRYFGRWNEAGEGELVSRWAGAYVKLGFSGDRVTVKLGDKPSSFYAIIDGGSPQHFQARTGEVELTVDGGATGTHQLRLIAEIGKELRFRGITLPDGQSVKPGEVHTGRVLFIGDSITYGANATNPTLDGWAPASADAAGLEHDRIAQGGIGLVDGYKAPLGTTGMEKQFFRQNSVSQPDGDKPFDFQKSPKPSIIVINLGTNDGNKNEDKPVPMDIFTERYAGFIGKLREQYPDATILALQLFNTYASAKNNAIGAAVAKVKDGGDSNVHYVGTKGWVNPDPKGGDIKPDWSHPTDQGHKKLTAKMAEVLKQYAGE